MVKTRYMKDNREELKEQGWRSPHTTI